MNLGKTLVAAAIFAGLIAGSTGCELITAVDRNKIGNNGGAAGTGGTGGTGGMTGGGGTGGTMCVPEDDMNECTDDVCDESNMPVHNNKMAGDPCTNGGSQCDGNGACVECLAADDCPGTDDDCQQRTCTMGACGMDFTAADTPVPTQMAGNCKVTVCDGAGATKDNNDDTDLPDDSNDCTSDTCDMGTPSNTNLSAGTACGMGGALVCNATGQCVGCNSPADCTGTDDECKARTCVNETCGVNFTAQDTPVAMQTDNDCLVQVCDGMGNIVASNDNNDTPLDDGNACTDETCAGGTPMHPNKADNTACNDGDGCTQTDTCQTGTCTGMNPVVCMAQDQCHVAGTCDSMTGMCSNPNVADGTSCNDSNGCTQSDTCQSGACTGANPVVCMAQDQCHVAGICDPMTGMCDSPNVADGTSCNDSNACTQTDTCQGGTCTGMSPVMCTALDQCHVAGTCDPMTGMCSNPNAANGTSCSDGSACTQTDTCQNGTCTGMNPVMCPAPAQCHVMGTCNPMTGMCNSPNAADGSMCMNGAVPGTCQGGACAACGDGVVQTGEQCDDANMVAGDCCSPTCQAEAGCEIEINNTCAAPNPIVLSGSPLTGSVKGSIRPIGDEDFYSFTLPGTLPQSVKVEIFIGGVGMCTAATGSSDAEVFLSQPCGTVLGSDDDDGPGLCPSINPTTDAFARNLAPNTYYLRTVKHNGGALITQYQLVVTVVSACGNGTVEAPETCDDGNLNSGDGCSNACATEAGYQCTGMPSTCVQIVCGNGIIQPGEVCDDSNMASGDGCSATCAVEANFQCVGQPSVCSPFETACGDGMDNDGDTFTDMADDDCVVTANFPPCAVGQTRKVYRSTDTPLAIPDALPAGVSSTINVAGSGTVQRAAIVYNITHTWDSDVDLFLTAPGGMPIDVCSDNGDNGDNFTRTVLDSTCSPNIGTLLTAASAPFTGCYAPETTFNTFNGASGDGAWVFKAADDTGMDTGTLQSWALILCTQ